MKKISIVVPMYNEEEVAKVCYERLSKVMQQLENYEYEILFINDGSKDNTIKILREIANTDKRVKVISFSRNFGHESANFCGLRKTSGDAVVIIDADLQDPPEIIPDMIKIWEEGYVVIYGKRKSRKGESIFKLVTSNAFYKLLNKFSDTVLPENTGDFRLIDRKVVNTICEMSEKNKYLRGLIAWTGGKQIAYEYDRDARYAGSTKYSLFKLIRLAKDAIFSFSKKPLRLVGNMGIISIVISVILFGYSLFSYFTGKAIEPGWTSIMVTITFFTGIQLLSLSVISEYIARIYDNSQGRPEYIVEEEINF